MKKETSEFKKRLMFLKGEDLYYLAYNSLVMLKEFECDTIETALLDYTKIAFLLEFVADNRLVDIVVAGDKSEGKHVTHNCRRLQAAYTQGLMRKHIIYRLMFALERKGLVSLQMNNNKGVVAVWMNNNKLPQGYFETELYESEVQNAKVIKKIHPRIRTMNLDTLLTRLYTDNGVQVWRV